LDDYQIKAAVDACLANARELLRAARALLDRENLPRMAFHLAALALEETGKAHLYSLHTVAAEADGDEGADYIVRSIEDRGHVRRLFWAIWSQTLGQEVISRQQIEEIQGLARHIHDTRLRGLYVDVEAGQLLVPETAVSPADAGMLIGMATARLELETAQSVRRELTAEERALRQWFLEASEDARLRNLVFSRTSMEKLATLGGPRAWMEWLKATVDEADSAAMEAAKREINRVAPSDSDERNKDKWRMRFRLRSASHSIRPKPLAVWNRGQLWIRLEKAKKDELLVDMTFPASILADRLYLTGWGLARTFTVALNIASLGFFWWELPRHVSRYYEKLEDLEAGQEVKLDRSPALRVDWGTHVLDLGALVRTAELFPVLAKSAPDHPLAPALSRYIEGLTWLSKSDIHMEFHAHSFGVFYEAFRLAIAALETDAHAAPLTPAVVGDAIKALHPEFDEIDRYVGAGEAFVSRRVLPSSFTLEQAAVMKAVCDHFLIKKLLKRHALLAAGDSTETG
jgi:AbiV family abortive infection protein